MKEKNNHLFPYKWYLKNGYPSPKIKKNKYNVFGTFICGGGSTMGYKLAGFNHLGGVEIDPPIADIYKTNHNPKYLYNEDIRAFNERNDLPNELYSLDILDGSPPCSTFSMAGSREKAWGKKKQFREGQAVQTLDDLVFVYCDTIIKLQPKVFLLENVKGIIQGNAKLYSKQIVEKMTKAGYNVQVFCLNAASMGVPQKRERVFFIGSKKELNFPKLKLEFNERAVVFGEVKSVTGARELNEYAYGKWLSAGEGGQLKGFGSNRRLSDKFVCNTVAGCQRKTGEAGLSHSTEARHLNKTEYCLVGTFPLDYDFGVFGREDYKIGYLIGMSVPPVMTAQIANQIRIQWLDQIK